MHIDIHNHCLPEVDDGADSLEDSLEMLRISERSGVGQIIVTPHYHYRRGHAPADKVCEKIAFLNQCAKEQNIKVHLYSGNEIYYCHDIVQLLDEHMMLTMAESQYALIEFSPSAAYEQMRNGLYKVIAGGYHPILAHADRVDTLVDQIYQMDELIHMGVYIQINLRSVKTEGSHAVRKFVKTAVKNDMVHFFATDAHHASVRTPDTADDVKYIQRKYGQNLLDLTMYENPMKVIKNEMI